MTCGPEPQRFRTLRPSSHWELDLGAQGDAVIRDTIRLVAMAPEIDALVDEHFLPPNLARGCSPCEWYLAVAGARCPLQGVLRLIDGRWCAFRPGGCALGYTEPVAIAAAGDHLAILDRALGRIDVLARGGRRILRSIPFAGTGPIALDAHGELYAADQRELFRFASDGSELARVTLPTTIERLAVDACHGVWIVVTGAATKQIWTWRDGELHQLDGDLAAALSGLPTTGVTTFPDHTFCITLPRGADAPCRLCFDECGRPHAPDGVPDVAARRGTVATAIGSPIDSFTPRCRWHRVRLDADVPGGTALTLRVATTEGEADVPHPSDWQVVDAAPTDFLVAQPAGRYLHLQIDLSSTVAASPVIRSIRLDLPRSTSAEWLPAIYREAPESSDFVERFLSIFDATIEDLDRAIERFPDLLDPARAPEDALPWLASLLGAMLDAAWTTERRRAFLVKLSELYRRRGTPAGVRLAIEALTGQVPVIDELNAPSPFGALAPVRGAAVAGGARIGEVRLFGRGRARVRLGSSALGATELKSYGDPDDDARTALAFRVRVSLPATTGIDAMRLERIVQAQLPAHVVATVRVGERSAAIGRAAAVGVDTLLVGLPRPILNQNLRLRRSSALWPGASRGEAVTSLGRAAALGMQTILR